MASYFFLSNTTHTPFVQLSIIYRAWGSLSKEKNNCFLFHKHTSYCLYSSIHTCIHEQMDPHIPLSILAKR